MTIYHLKLWLRQDADMLAVREIVAAYEGAKLDEDNYIVYYNTYPNKVTELAEELFPFRYEMRVTHETF